MKTRIAGQMTLKDALLAMSGGVPRALTVCISILKEGRK